MAIFPSIRIEGGLLGPDLLDELVAGALPGQKPADFGLPARRSLTDEIAAAFADARALWGVFQHRLDRLPPGDVGTTVTRDAWVVPLLGLLGYELHLNGRAREVDGLTFAISHRAGDPEDSPPLHIVGARQELGRVAASGRPRLAPHSLLQEYLNRTEHVWGIVTNGTTLRLLRDCTFVRRQAYVEFDVQAILDEPQFHDFAALYRLLHRTRLPRETGSDCLLEKYYLHSMEQGGRVREHLRDGVEDCLKLLGNGFLSHPANTDLQARVAPSCTGNDRISADAFYRQLLGLVYRFLFLLVSEDRGLLSQSSLYRDHYGIARLRRLVEVRAAYTDDADLWHSLRVLWRLLTRDDNNFNGGPMAAALGLPILNGDLFALTPIDDCVITNRALLEAIWRLTWYQEKASAPPRRVNYTALDVEELGSVYESLLEFHPAVAADAAGRLGFDLMAGSERKTTGSYYTPPELVAELVKSALEPVLEARLAAQRKHPEKAILGLRVCDPACGSGHFLLAAARRLGKELARVRVREEEPAPERVREAIRDVISHCIYGVDKNRLAVDLCRVALWLESHTADKPLTFLDHRVRVGDSLVGVFDLEVLKDGIPDKAFDPLGGDDKPTARALAAQNADERAGAQSLFPADLAGTLTTFTQHSREVDAITDDSPETIRRKKQLFESSHADAAWARQKQACDLWTAAFFQPLKPGVPAITTATLAQVLGGRQALPQIAAHAETIAGRQRFFHWPLEFPEVFANGGFDVILSNPPWERIKLQEQEFFAARDAGIANAANKAARSRLIKDLPQSKPGLHREYIDAQRAAAGTGVFLRHGSRYPLAGRGDINTYAVFAELTSSAIAPHGRAGVILPKGIATDDTTKHFFGSLVKTGRLIQLIGFENEDFIFPAVDHRVTFCTLTVGGGGSPVFQCRLAFYIRRFSQLAEENRFFQMRPDDFLLVNPNTGNCPIFRTQADAELTKAIYRRVPILWRQATESVPEANPWQLSFMRMFDMANDSEHFRGAAELEAEGYRREGSIYVGKHDRYLPLYEAKMLHQFDHRYSTYEGATQKQLNVGILPQPTVEQKRDPKFVVQPRYWVREDVVESVIPRQPDLVAKALDTGDRRMVQHALALWVAGYHLNLGNQEAGSRWLDAANKISNPQSFSGMLFNLTSDTVAKDLGRDFPLTEAEVRRIELQLEDPKVIAKDFVARFSPKWFLGWRDITNSGNERTIIATIAPRTAIGHTFPLAFLPGTPGQLACMLAANLNSLVGDYAARQKVGGTHVTYNLLKQFPVLPPAVWTAINTQGKTLRFGILELTYTANDLIPLARDCGYDGPPFRWDEDRRFEIRCELDAAFFHLYLPSEADGAWRLAEKETPEQLAALKKHFATPRDAVGFILEQFPIVREKDEKAHGRYRTKERILAIYDAMQAAQRAGKAYQTSLSPPPGEQAPQ